MFSGGEAMNSSNWKRYRVTEFHHTLSEDFDEDVEVTRAYLSMIPYISEKSQRMFDEALAAAREIENSRPRAKALRSMANNLAKFDRDRAMEIFDEALSSAGKIGDTQVRGAMLCFLVEDIANLDMERAISIARDMEEKEDKVVALLSIALKIEKTNHSRALELLEEAFSVAREIDAPEIRAGALQSVAEQYAHLETRDIFRKVPDELIMKMSDENWDAERVRETLKKYR